MKDLLPKAIIVSLLAGVLATLPFAILFTLEMDASLRLFVGLRYFAFGVSSALLIGLPIALVTFRLVGRDSGFGLGKLIFVANGVAIILVAFLAMVAGWFGVFFFGIPVALAANVFAIAGWLLIMRPLRISSND